MVSILILKWNWFEQINQIVQSGSYVENMASPQLSLRN